MVGRHPPADVIDRAQISWAAVCGRCTVIIWLNSSSEAACPHVHSVVFVTSDVNLTVKYEQKRTAIVGALFLKDYECPASNTVLYSVPASVEILSASDGYTFITNACEFCEFQSVFCLTYSCYGHV